MFFALFLYNESVMISSLTYNVFNIHIKYKVSRIKNRPMLWHDTHICHRQVLMHSLDNRDFHDIVNAFGNVLNNPPENVYIYIISYSKSISHEECRFFPSI